MCWEYFNSEWPGRCRRSAEFMVLLKAVGKMAREEACVADVHTGGSRRGFIWSQGTDISSVVGKGCPLREFRRSSLEYNRGSLLALLPPSPLPSLFSLAPPPSSPLHLPICSVLSCVPALVWLVCCVPLMLHTLGAASSSRAEQQDTPANGHPHELYTVWGL